MRMRLLAAVVLALPLVAAAQNTGELWEITSQMNIPGMPAGMGGQTQRVCQGDDPERRAAAEKKGQEECKVTDKKQTATRLQVTMTCKQGTMTIDQQYNAARTEFKGSMKMTSKEGEFVMNTTGRKVGACNVQQATFNPATHTAAGNELLVDLPNNTPQNNVFAADVYVGGRLTVPNVASLPPGTYTAPLTVTITVVN